MSTPIKISNCPIVDAIIELRFNPSVPKSAVFGIIYGKIGASFVKTDSLPILQIPENLRDNDPNLKFKPHYRLISNNGYALQLGPDVLVFASKIGYEGWLHFFTEFVQPILSDIINLNIFESFTRLGLRYINLFQSAKDSDFKVKLSIINNSIETSNIVTRSEHIKDGTSIILHYSTNTIMNSSLGQMNGHLIDIDASKVLTGMSFASSFVNDINDLHEKEKDFFFKLIEEELLEKLNPVYD